MRSIYCDRPADFVTHTSMTFPGLLYRTIQPVSGRSVIQDWLDKHPEGGMQHIAYRVTLDELDATVAELKGKGYPIISTFDTPIAKIVFFDTYEAIGVATKIMGITKEGEKAVEEMKQKMGQPPFTADLTWKKVEVEKFGYSHY